MVTEKEVYELSRTQRINNRAITGIETAHTNGKDTATGRLRVLDGRRLRYLEYDVEHPESFSFYPSFCGSDRDYRHRVNMDDQLRCRYSMLLKSERRRTEILASDSF